MGFSIYFLKGYGDGRPYLSALSEERRLRAERAGSAAVRRDTVFSYLLLRLALSEEFGVLSAPEFFYGEYGKPFLKETPELFFSLSHSGGAALCAVADFPIGADLQKIRPIASEVGRKFCTPFEMQTASRAADPDRALCRLWSLKESYGKLTGKGFSEGFSSIDTAALLSRGYAFAAEREGFYLAACAKRSIRPPTVRETTEEELFRLYGEND